MSTSLSFVALHQNGISSASSSQQNAPVEGSASATLSDPADRGSVLASVVASPAPTVNLTAMHLSQTVHRSEMQVHIDAQEFGRVSVHAAYGREGLAAQISTEATRLGSALGTALSGHIPAMEQRLRVDHVAHASVSVSTHTSTGDGAKERGARHGDGAPRSSGPSLRGEKSFATQTAADDQATTTLWSADGSRRLDIRI
jgi:hypothetical protein